MPDLFAPRRYWQKINTYFKKNMIQLAGSICHRNQFVSFICKKKHGYLSCKQHNLMKVRRFLYYWQRMIWWILIAEIKFPFLATKDNRRGPILSTNSMFGIEILFYLAWPLLMAHILLKYKLNKLSQKNWKLQYLKDLLLLK